MILGRILVVTHHDIRQGLAATHHDIRQGGVARFVEPEVGANHGGKGDCDVLQSSVHLPRH